MKKKIDQKKKNKRLLERGERDAMEKHACSGSKTGGQRSTRNERKGERTSHSTHKLR